MLRRNDRNLDNIPIGALGLISLEGCEEMGDKVNDYLVKWRREDGHIHKMMWLSADMNVTLIWLMPVFRVLARGSQGYHQGICPRNGSLPDGRCV